MKLFLFADSTLTSPCGKDPTCHDDEDPVRSQQPLTPYNRQDYVVPVTVATAAAAAAGDGVKYWDDCRQQVPPFLEHLLPALLRRVATTAGSAVDGSISAAPRADGAAGDVAGSYSGDDLFACSDCSKRYSSASNLARHRITHQRSPTTTGVAVVTKDRRVTRQCPHCAKVRLITNGFLYKLK